MFGQLSNWESLRDLIVALDAHHSKSYHLDLGKKYQNHLLPELIKTEIINFLRVSLVPCQ